MIRAGLVLSTSYLVGAGLWGVLAIAFPLLLAPVVAAMVRQVSSAVLFAAGSVAAAVAVGLRWAHEGWGFWVAVVVAGILYAVGGVSCMRHAIGVAVREGVVADYPGRPDRPGIGKVALTQRVAAAKYRYHWLLGALALLGGVLVLAGGGLALDRLAHPRWRAAPPAGLADWLSTVPARELGALGSLVVSGVVLVLLLLGVRTWQSPKMRTVVGIVWDLVAFWPRLAHPICPPPYGGRATIELTSRAVRLAGHHDVGADSRRSGIRRQPLLEGGPVAAAAGQDEGSCAPLERGETLLEDVLRRVLDAGVDVAELGQGEQVLGVLSIVEDVGRCLVDRRGAGVGDRVGLGARVDLLGLELPVR